MRYSALWLSALLCLRTEPVSAEHATGQAKRQLLNADILGAQTYDYVIVGGGTAGLVIANRLSADPSITVAVIEAGSLYQVTNPLISTFPAGDVFFVGSDPKQPLDVQPLVDWNLVTEPQAGANERKFRYARGKCLGGTSARNFMIYQRPTKGSLQQWADAVDDQSYTFDEWLPDFKRSVDFTPPGPTRATNASAEYKAAAFDSGAGPLQVSYSNYAGPFSSWVEGSLNEIGIGHAQDFNSGSLMGAQYCSSTIRPKTQTRETSQTSFLNAATTRSNLKVFSATMAKKILFNAEKKATGVRVTTALNLIGLTINARREVIVSGGAFHSPQLLMVSGIGPASTLRQHGIDVISDLAGVGQNLVDHILFGPAYRVKVDTLSRIVQDPIYLAAQVLEYAQQRGPLTNPVCDFLGWEKVPDSLRGSLSSSSIAELDQFDADWPEIEYLGAPGYVGAFTNLFATQPDDGYQYATILAALVAPTSVGSVTISSDDTDDLPVIDPNWLSTKTDQEVAIAAYKRVREAFASNFMKRVLADDEEYFPGPDVQTDAQILEVIRNTLQTVWHASGTCKMGRASDKMAVVDSRARVFGVTGLRVVDASSFALLPPGHPQSVVYALAEKIARHILSDD
ncbi:oxidoreductase GMC like protein [Zymoseptoria brevis]|uniref:Oxidoreductase GMC like protein n=1 Tax=Zymoseptoria brevis TaxID=1047168 RepID=A0A0F4GM32_9PEZI|nr:oxidoreductase GMC like protein [Zymoseptoria brevis]